MKFTIAALTGLTTVALASPTFQLEKRAAQTTCGRYDQISEAPYTIYTDLWGEDGYTGNGNGQCLTYNTVSGGAVSWSSNWTWTGGPYQVKSYSNVGLQMSPVQVSRIQSIPSTWSWSYTGQNLVVDVAYDLFTSSTANGNAEFEIMVWLGALGGAGPISSTGSPIATFSQAGTTFNLFKGQNGSFTVYSFVAQSPNQNFNGDINAFIKYLQTSQGFKGTQYLNSVQAGTEPFTGSGALFTTKSYSVKINGS